MKIIWDISEIERFADRLSDLSIFNKHMKNLSKELGGILRDMLLRYTPVKTGNLRSGWNGAYIITQTQDGFDVELTNDVEYATYVNDGHYSRNQLNPTSSGKPPYVVKNRTSKVYSVSGAKRGKTYVYGHFFVEKSVVETNAKLEYTLNKHLERWWKECLGG